MASATTGTHERIVEPEVWYQVQSVLRSRAQSGVRTQKHDHYLKGTLYCGRCRQRVTIIHAKNRHGNIDPYFICLVRRPHRPLCVGRGNKGRSVLMLIHDREVTVSDIQTGEILGEYTINPAKDYQAKNLHNTCQR